MSYRRGFLSEHPYPILTGGEVATHEISNSLPPGLMFNDSNGFISEFQPPSGILLCSRYGPTTVLVLHHGI